MMRAGIPVLVVTVLWAFALPVSAVQRLKEARGLPYSLDLSSNLEAELLPERSEAAMLAAVLMPSSIAALDVLSVNWPSKSPRLELAIGRTSQGTGKSRSQPYTVLTARVGDGEWRPLFNGAPRPGVVNQLAMWTAREDSHVVLLLSLAGADTGDSPVYAFSIGKDGVVQEIDTGGAASTYGGFEVIDLDDDGSFEVVTTRNLDGMAGGFSYHAVRTLVGNSYGPQPERFKPYFQAELAFLDWVVATRGELEADPEKFMNKGLYGFVYAAPYQNQLFGFDSIVEIPLSAGAKPDRTEYNRLRREAYERVVGYRDELREWLAGGQRPSIWKLPQ